MSLEKQPFVRYNEEKSSDTFTVRLNREERASLDTAKLIIHQPKDSSAIKTLAFMGAYVLQRQEMAYILDSVFNNKRKNRRLGIDEID